MINLLPPALKESVKYAKYNAKVIRYLRLILVVIIGLGISFGGTYYYLVQKTRTVDKSLADKTATIASYSDTIAQVQNLNARVAAIKAIQSNQPRFSRLLSDIAQFSLKGVSITSLTLTGDDSKPLSVAAVADSYNAAVSLRDALVSSPRISAADIQVITRVDDKHFTVTIVVGFKPGQAR